MPRRDGGSQPGRTSLCRALRWQGNTAVTVVVVGGGNEAEESLNAVRMR